MRDAAAGFSAATLCVSRSLKEAAECLVVIGTNISEPLVELWADLEFFKTNFLRMCATNYIPFKPKATRCQNKLVVANPPRETMRFVVHKLLKEGQVIIKKDVPVHSGQELVIHSVFLWSTLSGSKFISSIEIARGYRAALTGLDRTSLIKNIPAAHNGKAARLALHQFIQT